MRTPDFLIVGAMKAGTTTLFRDIGTHPGIFVPAEKEPNVLRDDRPRDAMVKDYGELFSRARPDQLCGEASTDYTKRPIYTGIASRARELCGAGLKVVYITRDPVGRMVSQYLHELQNGRIAMSFSEAIRCEARFIDTTRYEWQIAPWIELFGQKNVLMLSLDEYSADRERYAREVVKFVGLDPDSTPAIDPDSRANVAGEAKKLESPLLNSLLGSSLYQRRIKPMIPADLRERLRRKLLPWKELPEVDVSDDDRAYIETMLSAKPPFDMIVA